MAEAQLNLFFNFFMYGQYSVQKLKYNIKKMCDALSSTVLKFNTVPTHFIGKTRLSGSVSLISL